MADDQITSAREARTTACPSDSSEMMPEKTEPLSNSPEPAHSPQGRRLPLLVAFIAIVVITGIWLYVTKSPAADYVPLILVFLSAVAAIAGKSWDDNRTGLSRLTAKGRFLAALAVLGLIIGLRNTQSTQAKLKEVEKIQSIAYHQVMEGVSMILFPITSSWRDPPKSDSDILARAQDAKTIEFLDKTRIVPFADPARDTMMMIGDPRMFSLTANGARIASSCGYPHRGLRALYELFDFCVDGGEAKLKESEQLFMSNLDPETIKLVQDILEDDFYVSHYKNLRVESHRHIHVILARHKQQRVARLSVWINGHHLGHRPYGYIPFVYELTDHLNFGGENVVSVRVDNSKQTNCRWYSGSGIYRHTWLHVLNPVHVSQWGTFVICPRIAADAATVEVRTTVANSRDVAAQCKLMTVILDARGVTVAALETSQTIAAGDSTCFVQQLAVPNPNLWSPTNPYLYTVRSTLSDPENVADVYDTLFGIREAVFDAERGFLLNGHQIKLNGVCIHHEAGSVGAAVPLRVWERRLEILKEMGCNAIRTSHNPFAEEFLDLCDRMGFLVMAEAFDEWRVPKGQIRYGYSLYFDEWHERDLINFLHRDRNHPSIVLWSAGNEIGDQSAPDGAETLRELLRSFHREDPTRPVTAACDRIASEPPSNTVKPEFLAELDIVGYNYVDRWRDRAEKYYSIDHAAFPDRRLIGTESGALGGIRGDYRSLFASDNPAEVRRFLFQQNRNLDVEQLWQFVSTYEYVAGDFMWTGIDYLGESIWPMRISPSGVLDTCGFKKDGFYFYQSQWTQKPMIHLFPHWNWEEKKGQVIPVTCYTNCDTVELFLNGRSFGVKGYEFPRLGMEGTYGNYPERARALRTTADLHLTWDVPFEPGTLKAAGVKDGEVVSIVELVTTGTPAAIALAADRSSISADRRDVTHVVVEIQDEQGRVVPVAMNEIVFTLEGEGRLIGVDNGDPLSHEDFKANHRRAFNGLCMAIVQSTASAGAIRITATSPGLTSANLTINTAIGSA